MKIKKVKMLDFNEFTKELSKQFKRKYNDSGIWNCPNSPSFSLDPLDLSNYCGFFSGESKYICRFTLDPLCEPGMYKTAIIPDDPEEFLDKFAMNGYNSEYPDSKQHKLIRFDVALMWLVHKGILKMGEQIWLFHSW